MKEIDSMAHLVTSPENQQEFMNKLEKKISSGVFFHLINSEKYGLVIEVSIKVLEEGD